MKHWTKFLFIFFLLFLIFPVKNILARSGCCSHHGGVCGCGCCDGTSLSSTCAPYYPECGGGSYSSYQAPPSCPSMSSYNSSSGQCECYSGYIASGNSCISIDQACKNKYGYNSERDYSDDSCKCKYGYTWNSSATKCISQDEACQNQYGYNTKATLSGDKCECKYGYVWNSTNTKCITKDAACQELNGIMSRSNLSGECECLSGYEYDGSECVYLSSTPTILKKEPTKTPQNTPTLIPTESSISNDDILSTLNLISSPSSKLNSNDRHSYSVSSFFKKIFYQLFK